jgi:hypothetical protein
VNREPVLEEFALEVRDVVVMMLRAGEDPVGVLGAGLL